MTQTPNPNSRRRRLTADELIAILVSMAGIGSIFWWSISHRQAPPVDTTTTNQTAAADANVTQTFPLTQPTATPTARAAISPEPARPSASLLPSPVSSGDEVISNRPEQIGSPQITTSPRITTSSAPIPTVSGNLSSLPVPNNYLNTLQELGVLSDFSADAFQPNIPLTRGEYAKMLDRAFDRPVSQQVLAFADIPANYPRRAALDKSVKMGFMSGYSKTKFSPNEKIPRYQLLISLAKGLDLKIPANVDTILAKYTDANAMPKYAREKMAAAINSNFIIADDRANQLQPLKDTTRGEAAALIYQALVKEGKIPPGK
jgi:hypothetical protein